MRLFVETLVANIKSKSPIKEKKVFFISYCLKTEEAAFSFVELYVDRDFFNKLIR